MFEGAEHPLWSEVDPSLREGLFDHGARCGKVPAPMLVELGDLLPRLRIETTHRARRGLPERSGFIPASEPFLASGESHQHTLAHGTLEPTIERLPVAGESALRVDRFPEPAQSNEFLRVARVLGRAGDGRRHPARESRQRENIVPIVFEHSRKLARALSPQILEIGARNHEAREIVLTSEAKDVLLQRPEPTVAEPRAPETSSRSQEVEVEPVVRPAPPGETKRVSSNGRSKPVPL